MSNYFGFLENDKFITWEKKKQADYLISKKACFWSTIIKAAINDNVLFGDLNKAKYVFKPSNEAIEEFHEFIVMKYDRLISNGFVSFFRDFNNSVFGLSTEEQKRLALKKFNEIYKKVDVPQIEICSVGLRKFVPLFVPSPTKSLYVSCDQITRIKYCKF